MHFTPQMAAETMPALRNELDLAIREYKRARSAKNFDDCMEACDAVLRISESVVVDRSSREPISEISYALSCAGYYGWRKFELEIEKYEAEGAKPMLKAEVTNVAFKALSRLAYALAVADCVDSDMLEKYTIDLVTKANTKISNKRTRLRLLDPLCVPETTLGTLHGADIIRLVTNRSALERGFACVKQHACRALVGIYSALMDDELTKADFALAFGFSCEARRMMDESLALHVKDEDRARVIKDEDRARVIMWNLICDCKLIASRVDSTLRNSSTASDRSILGRVASELDRQDCCLDVLRQLSHVHKHVDSTIDELERKHNELVGRLESAGLAR